MFLFKVSSVKYVSVNENIERKMYDARDGITIGVIGTLCWVRKIIRNTDSRIRLQIQPVIPRNANAPGMWTLTLMYSLSAGLRLNAFIEYKTHNTTGMK